MSKSFIKIEKLNKQFETNNSTIQVLKDINLNLDSGKIISQCAIPVTYKDNKTSLELKLKKHENLDIRKVNGNKNKIFGQKNFDIVAHANKIYKFLNL